MFKGYTDGGSRTNTHAACSWIITSDADEVKYTNAVYLGPVTSNVAEYHAIIFCMVSALSGGVKELSIYQDSELVSRQMNGQYQVKAVHLIPLYMIAKHLSKQFDKIEFNWVPREHPMISMCDKNCDQILSNYMKV